MRQDDINYQNAFAGEPTPDPSEGQIISGPPVKNFDGLESVPYISNWQNALVTLKHDWLTSSTKQIIDSNRIKMEQEDTTSPVASEEDVQDAITAVPGLKVPKGARENTLDYLKNEQVEKNNSAFLLSLSKPGFMNRSVQLVNRGIADTLTNPLSLGVGAAAGAAVAAAVPEVSIPIGAFEVGSLGNALALSLGRTASIGATNFAVSELTDQAAEEEYDKATGQDFSSFNALKNIAKQGVIGAAMFGIPKALVEGFRPEVRQLFRTSIKAFGGKQAEDAAQAALNQAGLHGRDPTSAATLGYRRGIALSARIFKDNMDQAGVSVSEANKAANKIGNDIEDLHQPVKDEIGRQDKLMKKHKLTINQLTDLADEPLSDKTKSFLKDVDPKLQSVDDYLDQWQNLQNRNLTFEQLKATNFLHKHFINTDETEVPNDVYNDFIKEQDDPQNDFKSTGGVPTLEEPGRTFENATNALKDTYPESEQKRLLPDEDLLSDNEKNDLDEIKKSPERQKLFSRATDVLIKCLLGSET